jgi:putative N6-adenine-specific DNA methylase
MEMSRKIGLRSIKRIPFFNGPIECRLVVFDLYEGSSEET